MAKTDNHRKQYRIFDRTTHTWYEVVPEQYKKFDQWRTNLRKREQYWNRCFCPRSKWWLCDGNCLDCEFYISPTESLDAPILSDDGATNATLIPHAFIPLAPREKKRSHTSSLMLQNVPFIPLASRERKLPTQTAMN